MIDNSSSRILLECRIVGILKEFNRFKQDLPPDLYDGLPQITDCIRDMMLYEHRFDDGIETIWKIIEKYYIDGN